MTIDTIMTRNVVTVSMDNTVRQVRDMFAAHGFHHVVVVDRHRAVGIVSDRDLLAHLSPFLGGPQERTLDAACLNRKVHQIMTRKLIAAASGTPIDEAVAMILENKISCLPVIDANGDCVGIVTWRDMLRWMFAGRQDKPDFPQPERSAA